MRVASHWSVIGPGRRGGVGPGARRPSSDLKPETLVERGGSLQLHRLAGLVAGFLCFAVLAAAPAVAAPTVNVRVEGENGTLLERTKVTLSGDPVPGNSGCDGDSVGAALEAALGSNWDRSQFVTTLAGESHDFSRSDYWAEWLNTGSGYKRGNGVCTDDVADGNEVLMLVDMPPYGEGSTTEVPLSLRGVPAAAQRGTEVAVTVVGAVTTTQYGDAGDGTDKPVAGAIVSGGGASATTDANGRATLRLDQTGDVVLKASKAGTVPSGAERVAVTETPPPAANTTTPAASADTAAPAARIRGIHNGQRFTRERAPRTLRGSVTPDPSGLRAVKLSITRSVGGRCQLYSSSQERFRHSRCGRRVRFSIGDRQDWSYLLPKRLGKGRYVLDVVAVDKAGNRDTLARGRNRVVFFVR